MATIAPDDHEDLLRLFPGEGEMSRLIRTKDWTQTSLGHPRDWPQSLFIAVGILLGSRYPMEIWWGPDYLRFYNDAYRPLLGPNRHPQFLGRPGRECWAELWDEIGPMLDHVMATGVPTYSEDSLLQMTRRGFTEETYVTWSYGPIRDHHGAIGGIFCACDETTKKVLSQRRLAALHELGLTSKNAQAAPAETAQILVRNSADIPFALIYLCDGPEAKLIAHTGLDDPRLAPPTLPADAETPWPLHRLRLPAEPLVLTPLSDFLPSVPAGPWPESPHQAIAFHVPIAEGGTFAAVILGVSSRLELDPAYLDFLRLVARHIGSTLEAEVIRQQIEKERTRLKAAFMRSPAFMCILRGPDHVFDFVNEQYYSLIGHRDILGKPVATAIPEVVGQGFVDLLDTVYHTGTPYIGKDTVLSLQKKPDATLAETVINFVYQPIQETDGAVSGIFVHGIDITEEKAGQREREELLVSERAARSEAERTSRMKDEFLATLSHELRTPLNAILGWSSILRTGRAAGPDLDTGLETIERNARAQTQIIEDLLDMSRIISGKVRLDVQRIELQEVLRDSIQTVQSAADAKGIRFQSVLDPFAGPVSGDPSRLQQVFWNLLNNAIKFTDKGGRVQVLLERVNSHIEISIIDSGQGIAPEFLPYVFDRFQQADSSSTRRYGGLGLGLAIVKQLVELHGGSVRAKSGGAGQGATFVVNLPLSILHPEHTDDHPARRHPTRGEATPEPSPLSLKGLRVLAVDDEPDARALVKRVLETSHAQVETAALATEAFAKLQADRFDVLVCDIGMPGEDGYTLMERIRDGANLNSDTPAVALTAYARSEDRTKALRAGFQMHISKPVEPGELVTVVASLAGRPRKLS